MSVEYIKEIAFLQEVKTAGQIWVARSIHNNIYSVEIDATGVSLPVWSNRERVDAYLVNARLVGAKYEPYAILLGEFTRRWLSDMTMAIVELQLNPDGKTTRVLVVTAEEFKAKQASKTESDTLAFRQ
ncbi:MAG TPA: DUF2750 domain-containing protein [Geobacteraceae bacterium]